MQIDTLHDIVLGVFNFIIPSMKGDRDMKMSQIRQGHCYIINDDFEKIDCVAVDLANSNLLTIKKGVQRTARPFCCIEKDETKGIVWLAPMSTKINKYSELQKEKIEKYGSCNDFVFTKWNQKPNAILLQNAFPILPRFIESTFIKNETGNVFAVNSSAQRVINKFWGIKKIAIDKDIKVTFTNVKEYLDYAFKNDFRPFEELNSVQRREVIMRYYKTDVLTANENFLTEEQILAYEKEIARISQPLFTQKTRFYNAHTFERKETLTYEFGNTAYKTLKGQKLFYVTCDTTEKLLNIGKTLDDAEIEYRGLLNENGTGQVKILYSDRERLYNALKAPSNSLKPLGNINYTTSRSGSCVAFKNEFDGDTAIRFAKSLSQHKMRFRLEFKKGGTAKLICFADKYSEVCRILKSSLEDMKKEQLFIKPKGNVQKGALSL